VGVPHGAELEQAEEALATAGAHLGEKHGTPHGGPDRDGDDSHRRRQEHQTCGRHGHVKNALD
jgi:hypothetical protein